MAAGSFPTKNRAEVSGRQNLVKWWCQWPRIYFIQSYGCHIMHTFTYDQYTCFTGDKTTTAVLKWKLTSHWVWVTGLLWSRETAVSTVVFTNTMFSLRKRPWPSETCLTLLGAHFLNSVLEEKTDKDNINSNLYRLSESQTCNLFIEHLDSDQQV